LPPALGATPRPVDPTAASVGLPAVLRAASADEILKARRLVPDSHGQDNVKRDEMVGPEHVVLTGHIDMADFSPSEFFEDDPIGNGRGLFEYRNFRSVKVCRAPACAAAALLPIAMSCMHSILLSISQGLARAIPSCREHQ
jgi:hypothetical protein